MGALRHSPATSAFGYHAAVPLTFFMAGTAHPVGGPKELNRIVLEILARYDVELRPGNWSTGSWSSAAG
ncbi:hypothetical protein NKG94_00795 [Micromonospora sp. M12]